MADVNANIGINFDTSNALAQLRQLQAGLSRFNQSLTQGNVAAMQAQKGLNDQLMQAINATGKFVATQKDVATSTSSFTQALEKNQLSMREYFRYTVAAATANTKTFKGMFAQEREIINRARKDRVKLLQSQYIQMQAANGDMIKVLQVIPKHLKMVNGQYADYATRMQMAAQRQQFLNQLLKQGSTQLLNFGKNTQWAGRQLMVGLTIPLTILGSTAAKTFMEMEEAVLKFTRVYGDMTTSGDATNKAVEDIQRLGKEFTKYGIAVKDTMEMAASAAAMGLQGSDLQAQVINATRLSVLGQVEQQQALETTISLTNAFGLASEDLAKKINFLNAVENQTVLSIEDLTIAIPKAGPVVKQLGGNVEDLAFFMTAMKEGGINASEGANALKSGLASLINPSKKAAGFLADLGINVKGIVEANAGDLKGTVVGFARALDTLDPLNRARAIEQMFGKFQFARLSTLFQNVTKDSSQAARALGLAGASVEELAILSERELKKIEDSTGAKFKKAMENLKTQLVPVGKAFLEAVTPIVAFAGKILEKFNGLSDGTKKVITIMIGVIGGLAPVALMTFGILANGVANIIKFFALLRGGIAKLNGSNQVLGGGFDYLTNQQIENLAETNALHTSHSQLISTFNLEKAAVESLASAYGNASSQARALASNSPGLFNTVPGPAGAVAGLPPKKFATGGVVPGTGNKDTVPALLTPGEVVITKQTAKENPELVAALQNGSVMKYAKGTGKKRNIVTPHTGRVSGGQVETRLFSGAAIMAPGNQATGAVEGSSLSGMDSRFIAQMDESGKEVVGATEQFKAAHAAALKTQMMQVDGITTFNEKTYASYTENWENIDSVLDSIADEFARGIGPGVSDVSKLGQDQFPKISAHIDELERSTKITAEQANTLRESTRKLFNPDLGTPANPGRDAVAKNRQRVETGIDDAGNEVVTRVGVERVALPGKVGSDYLDDRTKANTAREYARRGVTPPEGKVTFAHIKSGEKGTDFETPIASAKDGISEAEKRIVDTLTSGGKVKEGTVVITKQIAQSVEEGLAAAEKTAEVQSPSKRTKRLGQDIGKGLQEGLADSLPAVKAQSDRLAEAAVPSAAETQSKINKMDLGNKAFYDDINTPEMRDERQILKSLDRQRRKRGAGGRVGVPSDATSSTSIVTLSAEARSKTKESSESTVLLAEKTEELAGVTEEALDAQTNNAANLLTGSQITDATATNLGEVLQATGQTGLAQQSLADSSGNIANINDQIETEKKRELERLKRYNAEQAAQQAADKAVIPAGSQSNTGYINPATAMNSVDAYEEASTYTRDKSGSILFDPETGNPTTLTAKQISQKKRGMRKERVGRVSGKAAGALGTATMVAGMAGAPPQVTGALGTAATVAQFAPMIAGLTGPQGIVVALAAVAAGAYLFNKHLNAMAGKAAQFAKDLSATREGLKSIGEISGKVGASQIMDKRREKSQYGKYDEAIKIDDTFGKQFVGSDTGKKEKKLFQENIKQFGKDKAVSDLSLKLATAVADGVLDSNQANSIAAAMALELKDSKIEMQVVGQVSSLIGPDGKDLKDNPMETRIGIMAKAGARTSKLENEIAGKTGFGESSRKEVAALAALNMNNLELTTMMADQVQVEYETQKKKLEAELASTTNAQKKLELEQQISDLNSQNLKDTAFMNDQILAQINRNAASFAKVYSDSVWGKQAMREDAYLDASKAQVESTYKGTDQEAAAKSFLNKTKALKTDTVTGRYNSSTGQYVKTGLGTAEAAQKFQAKMEMLVGSKVLSPGEATSYMDLFRGKLNEMDFMLNMGIKTRGIAKTKELFNMFSGFSAGGRKQATSIISEMIMKKKDPAEFDSIMESLKSIQALDGNTIDFEILVKTIGLVGIEKIKEEQEAIEKLKESAEKSGTKINLDDVAKVDANMAAAVQALKESPERLKEYQAGEVEQQAEYLQKLAAQYMHETTVNEQQRTADIEMLAQEQAMVEAWEKGVATGTTAFQTILDQKIADLTALSKGKFAVQKLKFTAGVGIDSNTPPPVSTPDSGTKANPLEFLDSLAMRIKNVRDGAFDATKPLESMLAAFTSKKAQKDVSRMFDMFDGLQQRLIKLKAPKEFRDMISGMSSEDFKELANLKGDKAIFKFKKGKPRTKSNIEGLTKTGNALMRTYREAQLGEANVVNRETVAEIADKEKAFRVLIANGVSAADALNQVEDAAVAAAIASGTLGKNGSKEMNKYVGDLKKANSELERFNLKQDMIRRNEEFKLLEQMPKLMTAMKTAGMSADQMAAALEDPALAKHLIEDLKDGKVDAQEIADYLNSIEAKKIIDIQVNYNAGKFGAAAQPGIDAAEELFSALEGGIRNGVAGFSSAQNQLDVATISKNNKLIAEAELKAAGFRQQIELINREIRGMERDIELNYTRPIEDAQEQISDMERQLEMNPLFGDRAIGKLNDENTKLSNDMAIMANQAEKINERYDKQAEALQKVADINDGIIAQQQSQLDLADALTQGDIAAAARSMQQSRADQASRNQTGVMDALEQARTNELEGLRGAESGLSQLQIQERQYEISQAIYKMENDPARLKITADILALQDKIYNFEEAREAAVLKIRDKEDEIYKINKEKLWPLEDSIADMQYQNDLAQRRLDIDVSNLTVLGKSREEFEKMKAEIALNEVAAKNLTAVFGGMLAAIEAIRAKWGEVIAAIGAAQNAASAQAVATTIKTNEETAKKEVASEKAATNVVTAKSDSAAFAESQKAAAEYAAAKAAGDTAAALKAAAKVIPSALASKESGAIGAASISAQFKAAEAALKASSTSSIIAARRARDGYLSSGGLVPKYFNTGGFAMGTDTVPAMLTPGEFVMSKYAVQSYGIDKMRAINNGSSVGDSVYNYSINVNVESEANPDEIARVVMTQIRNIDGQKLRGTRI